MASGGGTGNGGQNSSPFRIPTQLSSPVSSSPFIQTTGMAGAGGLPDTTHISAMATSSSCGMSGGQTTLTASSSMGTASASNLFGGMPMMGPGLTGSESSTAYNPFQAPSPPPSSINLVFPTNHMNQTTSDAGLDRSSQSRMQTTPFTQSLGSSPVFQSSLIQSTEMASSGSLPGTTHISAMATSSSCGMSGGQTTLTPSSSMGTGRNSNLFGGVPMMGSGLTGSDTTAAYNLFKTLSPPASSISMVFPPSHKSQTTSDAGSCRSAQSRMQDTPRTSSLTSNIFGGKQAALSPQSTSVISCTTTPVFATRPIPSKVEPSAVASAKPSTTSNIFGGGTGTPKLFEKTKMDKVRSKASITPSSSEAAPNKTFAPPTLSSNVFGAGGIGLSSSSNQATINLFGGSASDKGQSGEPKGSGSTSSNLFGGVGKDKGQSGEPNSGGSAGANLFGGVKKDRPHPGVSEDSTAPGNLFGGVKRDLAQVGPLAAPIGHFGSMKDVNPTSIVASQVFDASLSGPDAPKTSKSNPFGDAFPKSKEKLSTTTQPVFGAPKSRINESPIFGAQTGNTSDQLFGNVEGKARKGLKLDTNISSTNEVDNQNIPQSPSTPTTTCKLESPPGTSPEFDKKELTKIIVTQIPDTCMDRDVLRNHFEKFGKVKRVTLNPKSNQATVQYEDHRGASKAKKKAKKIHPNLPEVGLFYGTPARRRSEDGNSDAIISKKKAIKTLTQSQSINESSDLEPYVPLSRPSNDPSDMPQPLQQVPSKDPTEVPKRIAVLPQSKKKEAAKVMKKKVTARKPQPRETSKGKKEPTISTESKDLREILASQCMTNHDRYIVLKARDDHLRKEVTRTSDIENAKYLSATCPDMCPEKERYMRDVQIDMSSFEQTNGVMDQTLVIKKFSRSSADKDEPLPHELRPGPVLLKTLDFLVCNIIDRGDDGEMEIDVWYNYLWNRTRAIRNDLSTQQLTDGNAVVIMERCTRFHIHTAARLCQEPPDLFDSKMNTEHLVKSLQTLKELYKDLGEQGQFYDSEPEFRAYQLLLNLNEGETVMIQYSQYQEKVQKSIEVQFALKVGMALMFNNYVQFFKMIKSATYLQGCILHRYFRQVRLKALDTIMKAYVPVKQTRKYPLAKIVKTLGFEGEQDASTYLEIHGIKVLDDTNVLLDRQTFTLHPEEMPPIIRAIKLVESNRTCSVGEVIQGGPLPENPLKTYTPHNSFNSQGILKQEAYDATDQQQQHQGQQDSIPKPMPVIKVNVDRQQQQRLSKRDVESFKENIYSDVLKSVINDEAKEALAETQEKIYMMDLAGKALAEDILEESKCEVAFGASQDALQEVGKEEEERLKKKIEEKTRKRRAVEELRDLIARTLCDEYYGQFVDSMRRVICQDAIEEMQWEAVLKDLQMELPQALSLEVIVGEVQRICSEVIAAKNEELEKQITQIQERVNLRKMQDCFRKWKLQVLRVKRRKLAQETFPASCSQLSMKQQNEAFGWGYPRGKTGIASAYQVSLMEDSVSNSIKDLTATGNLIRANAWHYLPLKQEMIKVESSLKTTNLITQFFKVVICTSVTPDSLILQWLRAKLSFTDHYKVNEPLNTSFSFLSENGDKEYGCVIREVSQNSFSLEDFKGTLAVIYVTTPSDSTPLSSQLKHKANVPKITIHYGGEACATDDQAVWNITEGDLFLPETSQKLSANILGLWKKSQNQCQLVSTPMNSYIHGFISCKVVGMFLYTNKERIDDRKSPLPPQAYIDLYNEALSHLQNVVNDEELLNLDWPPPELCDLRQVPPASWNKGDRMKANSILGSLRLPKLALDTFMSWRAIREALNSYASEISNDESSNIVLMSHLIVLLNNSLKIIGPANDNDVEGSRDSNIHILRLPWTELIYACISHKLTGLPDIPVFHQPKKLDVFKYPPSWWEACDTSDALWSQMTKEKENEPPTTKKRKHDRPADHKPVSKKQSQLLLDIESEKNKYDAFEKRLKDILSEDDFLNLYPTTED